MEEKYLQSAAEKDKLSALYNQAVMSTIRGKINLKDETIAEMSTSYRQKLEEIEGNLKQLNSTRIFRLLHLYSRIRNQLFRGTKEERREFFKWLFDKNSRTNEIKYLPTGYILENIYRMEDELSERPLEIEWKNHSKAKSNNTYDIIELSIISYEQMFQRPQHFASRFANDGHRVFYINADFKLRSSITYPKDNLAVVGMSVPGARDIYGYISPDEQNRIIKNMEQIIHDNGIHNAVLVVDYPNWYKTALYLKAQYGFPIVYDYMDDFENFNGDSKDFIWENSRNLLEICDFVTPSSAYLTEKVNERFKGLVETIRNGTEFEHFNKATEIKKSGGHKVIGYYGAISAWFDIEKIKYAAERFPQYNIMLIGDITEENREALSGFKNVKILGKKPYTDLPEYLAQFDVCLIPFKSDLNLIKATNPVKFYEYLCAGKKIVATEIPELEPFRDKFAYLENDSKKFCDAIEKCLNGTDTLASYEECIDFAKNNDWDERYFRFKNGVSELYPKASIIVLTYNNLKYTKKCVESVFAHTTYPNYELILVDNASSDGTQDYFRELKEKYPDRVKIQLNEDNLGFAEGNNCGIRISDGKYIVLLNNDTMVSDGWLFPLIRRLEMDYGVGITGPVCNSIGNEACIYCDYENEEDMYKFADYYTLNHPNEEITDPSCLAFFCVAIPRRVIDECGLLDNRYARGFYEDDDYSRNVHEHGYRLIILKNSFVHHFGSASFNLLGNTEKDKLMQHNRQLFEEKWETKWVAPHYTDKRISPQSIDKTRFSI